MGSARDYLCESCGHEAKWVTADFDYGFSGDVTTPAVCPEHGVQQADTGLKAWDEGWKGRQRDSYPCPECHQDRPLRDRATCPKCGQPKMVVNPAGAMTCWD